MAFTNSKYTCSLENDAIKISRTESVTYGNGLLSIDFMRTIRVPENITVATKLPSGLGKFPLSKVSDYADKLPSGAQVDRGVFFPMHREESMWISFRAEDRFVVRIYAGGVNAVSGMHWIGTQASPPRQHTAMVPGQDYLMVEPRPLRPCTLDGIAVEPDVFRQFEALPSGQHGYSAKILMSPEQFVSDLQIEITARKRPLIRAPPPRLWPTPEQEEKRREGWGNGAGSSSNTLPARTSSGLVSSFFGFVRGDRSGISLPLAVSMKPEELKNGKFKTARGKTNESRPDAKHKPDNAIVSVTQQVDTSASSKEPEHIVEVAAGGIVKQDIRETFWFGLDTWDSDHTITIPVHILNPDAYRQVTGRTAPPSPVNDEHFLRAGISLSDLVKGQQGSGSVLQRIIDSKRFRARIKSIHAHGRLQSTQHAQHGDRGTTVEDDKSTGLVELHGAVEDPDCLISHAGPFCPFRTSMDFLTMAKDPDSNLDAR
ncbi:integral membrane protein [Apiospora arundinis]